MNSLTIIGNLTKDPEIRATTSGEEVCNFTVAVNPRKRAQNLNQPDPQFFRVAAWRELGKNCAKFLVKGKKVCVVGPVEVRTYQGADGVTRASLEVVAREVEFLSAKDENDNPAPAVQTPAGFTAVETDELPFE